VVWSLVPIGNPKPFIAPHPGRPETGKTSTGIDTSVDVSNAHDRDHSIGLGFRVPLVVASPWSRGGCVNSQVFDHTSMIMLVEKWLAGKKKPVVESNISEWRRTVCGDLTSVFRRYSGEAYPFPESLKRDEVVEQIHKAKFKGKANGGQPLKSKEIEAFDLRAFQEPGTRPSCPLAYELEVNADRRGDKLTITMEAGNKRFGPQSLGSPFNAYFYKGGDLVSRAYACRAGDAPVLDEFEVTGSYHVRVDGPNGFMREFRCTGSEPKVRVAANASGDEILIQVANQGSMELSVGAKDESYGLSAQQHQLPQGKTGKYRVSTRDTHGWYDFSVVIGDLRYRYAGRIETGKWSVTDPSMA